MVPDICLAVAERFALQGKRVLVLLTDMTNFADALKEIAITMEQVPSNRGYPGDLYSQLAARYEKAVDFEGAGSITILAVTTMPGDDVTHPVPDNTGYITEGQFYLQERPHRALRLPLAAQAAGQRKTRDDHRAIMDGMIQLYAAYKETLEKKAMGFRMSDWDQKLLQYGGALRAGDDGPVGQHPAGGGAGHGLGDPGRLLRARGDGPADRADREVLAQKALKRTSDGQDQADQERAQEAEGRAEALPALPAHAQLKKQQLQMEIRRVESQRKPAWPTVRP